MLIRIPVLPPIKGLSRHIYAHPRENFRRSRHGTVFAVQVGKTHGVNLRGCPHPAMPVLSRKGEAAVLDQKRIEAQVASHSNRRLDRIICDHSKDDERSLLRDTEPGFEIRTNKCAIGALAEHDLTTPRLGFGLEIVTGLAGAIVRCRLR